MKGSRPVRKYVLCKMHKVHVFGALNAKKAVTKMSNALNRYKFIAFVRRLRKLHHKLCIIVDNARWHLTNEILKYIEEKDIVLIRLPPYSPELNPIEQYWKNVKSLLAMREYFTKDELVREVKNALRKRNLVPEIYDY